jgi:hypothetical protein
MQAMKIIVEEGDTFTGMVPGTYTFHAREVRLNREVDRDFSPMTGRVGVIRDMREVLTLVGALGSRELPPARGGVVRAPSPGLMVEAFVPKRMDRMIMDDVCSGHGLVSQAIKRALGVPPEMLSRAKCEECRGTGEWENPANGRRSPCSRGCKR